MMEDPKTFVTEVLEKVIDEEDVDTNDTATVTSKSRRIKKSNLRHFKKSKGEMAAEVSKLQVRRNRAT